MFDFLPKIMKKTDSKDEIARLLGTDKAALDAFEKSYAKHVLTAEPSDNFFEVNSRQAAAAHEGILPEMMPDVGELTDRIVNELLPQTPVLIYDGRRIQEYESAAQFVSVEECEKSCSAVTNEEISALPEPLRPQLTGSLMKVDINEPSYIILLEMYQKWRKTGNMHAYYAFRQGMDILDLDEITYQIIGINPNSMGYWFPAIVEAASTQDFFKIPKTTIIKVPTTMLQLTRLEYQSLTRTTLDIVDRFCQKAFQLNEDMDYFIKTGTYSSKFDFRNVRVHGAKEVRELGEYLLYIHHQACMMAGPLSTPCIYGAGTTNEWVVREFIEDKENNPCIYKGLPLHTEYRVFVDFDTNEVIGMNPYWDPTVMKQRFGHDDDSGSVHNVHDYIIYSAHEETLMRRYNENCDKVKDQMKSLIMNTKGLSGQWSVDIMQNGDDFWIIDMGLAVNSALVECVPKNLLRPVEENWIPELAQMPNHLEAKNE